MSSMVGTRPVAASGSDPVTIGGVNVLLHLATPAEWRAHLAAGAIAPSVAEFVHLSTSEQVALPADRMFRGRRDILLLVLDPERIGVPVRWEPGVPTDPASMRFPHAYGPVPVSAVLGVLPYRPRTDGSFGAPALPDLDDAGRSRLATPSLLRRAATQELPVAGGVAVLTGPVPCSRQHNQLLVDGDVEAATVAAEADRTLGGLAHRMALLASAPLAAGMAALGWEVEELTVMAAPAGGTSGGPVRQVDIEDARPFWDASWRRAVPGIDPATLAQLTDRYALEREVVDLRCLAAFTGSELAAACLLKIDGATAVVDAVETAPEHRGRGHGNALLAEARAMAAAAGCDLVTLEAAAADWPRHWYARHGFTEVGRAWSAALRGRAAPSG
jgi:uncharacterized protein (DUF952 family)/ribosomal protein S18 acetylase RimI-like enzyme